MKRTVAVKYDGLFCKVTLSGEPTQAIIDLFSGFFYSCEQNAEKGVTLIVLFNMMDSDKDVIEWVITALVEDGFKQTGEQL